MKKIFKIYTGIFIFLIIFSLSASLLLPEASAADVTFKPQVPIGSFTGGSVEPNTIGNYIKAIYVYAIGAVGILAAFMIMFNGFNWVISAGNQEKIKEAQSKIAAALSGLVLVLFAYALFNFINPDLVNLKSIDPKTIELEEQASGIAEDRYKNCSWDIVYTCASGRTQSDGKCPEETKPAEPRHSICCCEITPLTGCSWTNLYNCSTGTIKSDEDNCGSKSTTSQTCCCQESKIKDCQDCVQTSLPTRGTSADNMVNKDLNSALEKAFAEYPNLVITELWPPTTETHINPCHYIGTCVDAAMANRTTEETEVKKAFDALSGSGVSSVVYETSLDCAPYEKLDIECKNYSHITAPHFSVYK